MIYSAELETEISAWSVSGVQSAKWSQDKEWETGYAMWKETHALEAIDSIFAFEEYFQANNLRHKQKCNPKPC